MFVWEWKNLYSHSAEILISRSLYRFPLVTLIRARGTGGPSPVAVVPNRPTPLMRLESATGSKGRSPASNWAMGAYLMKALRGMARCHVPKSPGAGPCHQSPRVTMLDRVSKRQRGRRTCPYVDSSSTSYKCFRGSFGSSSNEWISQKWMNSRKERLTDNQCSSNTVNVLGTQMTMVPIGGISPFVSNIWICCNQPKTSWLLRSFN